MAGRLVGVTAGLVVGATAAALAQTGPSSVARSHAGKIWVLNEAGATAATKPADREPLTAGRHGRHGDATGSISLVLRLRSAIEQAVAKAHVQPVRDIDFPLRGGTTVPLSIRLRPLPAAILSVKPGWRGNEFFLTGNEIVLVQPTTSKIVEVHRYKE